VSTDLVTQQIEAVVSDIGVHAAKTGMLPTAAIVEAVAAAVADLDIPLLVVDPVMIATSGDRLIDDEAVASIRAELVGRAFVVTPNIPEAEALAELRITTDEDRRTAARRIAALGATAVVIKGGHFASPDISDLLYDGERFVEFRTERIAGASTHGTGCTFAAALAAHLALGTPLADAVPLVQEYIAGALRSAPRLGHGHGPMNHFWKLY
jgi:hydroxymethylpyrimidine/phosphomethylpyrimidine kinase